MYTLPRIARPIDACLHEHADPFSHGIDSRTPHFGGSNVMTERMHAHTVSINILAYFAFTLAYSQN